MSDKWFGKDGGCYGSIWEKRAADARYEQQQKQNKLLEEQNKLLRQQENIQKQEQERQRAREIAEKEENWEKFENSEIEYCEDSLTLYSYLNEIKNSKEIKEKIIESIDYIENSLKNYTLCNMIQYKKEILETKEKMKEETDYFKDMSLYWINLTEELYNKYEKIYIRIISVLEDCIKQRKKLNMMFCNDLYEELHTRIIKYKDEQFRKLYEQFRVKDIPKEKKILDVLDEGKRELQIKSICEKLNLQKELISQIKRTEDVKINKLKREQKEFKEEINDRKEQINKLKEITNLDNLKQIKENVVDIDYEFSSEIVSDLYSIDEIKLMIKRHIKELEKDLLKIEEKGKYYKLVDYLINNETYANLEDYEKYYEDIDYDEEYKRVLEFEKEQKILEEERRKREEQERIEKEKEQQKLEEKRKEEEENKKQKNLEKKLLDIYEKSKSYKSILKWILLPAIIVMVRINNMYYHYSTYIFNFRPYYSCSTINANIYFSLCIWDKIIIQKGLFKRY